MVNLLIIVSKNSLSLIYHNINQYVIIFWVVIMNILHLRYACEIEKTKSISKAAENLFMSQPNLSRAVKDLESSLNIQIFERTSKGMKVTVKGEEFLYYAKKYFQK